MASTCGLCAGQEVAAHRGTLRCLEDEKRKVADLVATMQERRPLTVAQQTLALAAARREYKRLVALVAQTELAMNRARPRVAGGES